MIKLKDVKVLVVGIQGSGKTELAKHLINSFKHPVWYLMHKDDAKGMPFKTMVINAKASTLEELDLICEKIIAMKKSKESRIDCIVIDEADMFLKSPLPRNINDLVINHRHYGLAVIFITRRPQDIPTKIVESCQHTFIYALPNSDNIDRKLGALHRDLPTMLPLLDKDKHNFIHIALGKNPVLMKPIEINERSKTNK